MSPERVLQRRRWLASARQLVVQSAMVRGWWARDAKLAINEEAKAGDEDGGKQGIRNEQETAQKEDSESQKSDSMPCCGRSCLPRHQPCLPLGVGVLRQKWSAGQVLT